MVDGILTTPGSICLLLKLGHKLSRQILKPSSTPLLFPFSQPASRPNCLMGDTAGNYILVRADRCSVPICPLPHPKYIWWITQLKSVPSITTNQCNHGGSPGRGRVIGDKCRGQHFYNTYLARARIQYLATTLHTRQHRWQLILCCKVWTKGTQFYEPFSTCLWKKVLL